MRCSECEDLRRKLLKAIMAMQNAKLHIEFRYDRASRERYEPYRELVEGLRELGQTVQEERHQPVTRPCPTT